MHRSRGASLHIAPKRRAHAPLVVLDLHTVAAVDLLHLRLEVLIAARKCVHARPLVVVAPVLIEETDGSHGAVIRHALKRAALVHQEGQDGVALRDDLVGLLGHDRAERQAAQARVEDVRLEGGAHVLVQHAVGLRDHGLGLVAPRVEEEVLEPRVLRAVVGAGARVGAELGLAREGRCCCVWRQVLPQLESFLLAGFTICTVHKYAGALLASRERGVRPLSQTLRPGNPKS